MNEAIQIRQKLIDIYLEWRNDYLTVERFAEHKGLTVEQANVLIDLAREVANSPHPDA